MVVNSGWVDSRAVRPRLQESSISLLDGLTKPIRDHRHGDAYDWRQNQDAHV